MKWMQRLMPASVAAMVLMSMAGCSSDQEELGTWMEAQQQQARPVVKPLSPPQKFDPERYAVADQVEPFSVEKLTVVLRKQDVQPNSLIAAELNRRREPLEAYPLDNIKMVGSVARKGQPYALLKVDNLLYQVKVGDHLGQNNGKIMKVTETEIELREIVQDASGEWIERTSALQLQEGAQ